MNFTSTKSIESDSFDVCAALRLAFGMVITTVLLLPTTGCSGKKEKADGGGDSSSSAVTWAGETKIDSLNADVKIGIIGEPPAAADPLMVCVAITKDGDPIKDLKVEFASGEQWVRKAGDQSEHTVFAGLPRLEFKEATDGVPASYQASKFASQFVPRNVEGKYPVRILIEDKNGMRVLDHGVEVDVKN